MKTLEITVHRLMDGIWLVMPFTGRCMYLRTMFLLVGVSIAGCYFSPLQAQDIEIVNPSLEGKPGEDKFPLQWVKLGASPDILPMGSYPPYVTLPPSDGKTYAGMLAHVRSSEGIAIAIKELKANRTYTLSFDLAYPPRYHSQVICNGSMAVYGENSPGDKAELLWKSGLFYHTNWKRYTITFRAARKHKYLAFRPYFTSCGQRFSGALIDNLSSSIREAPELELSAQSTCRGTSNGAAVVNVIAGQGPFTYLWKPGNYTTPEITGLPTGAYEVTVTAADGLKTKGTVKVGESDLKSLAAVISAKCHGNPDNRIVINTTGGIPPYRYYLDTSNLASYTNIFGNLSVGRYDIRVRDEWGCDNTINGIRVEEPLPLAVRLVTTAPTACDGATNGKIIPQASGGIPPYEYRIENGMWQQSNTFDNLGAGYYRFEIRDSYSCVTTAAANVASMAMNCLIVMPTAFSPNGDGNNDLFRPKLYDQVRDYQLAVYNRWGGLVFRTNDPGTGWDGYYRGASQSGQTFVYLCTFVNSKNEHQELRGAVLLVR